MFGEGNVGQLVLEAGHLGRAAPASLGGDDHPVDEQLAAPHTARLLPLDGTFEAGDERGAAQAQALGPGDVRWLPAEEHVGELPAPVVAAGMGPPGHHVPRERLTRRVWSWVRRLDHLVRYLWGVSRPSARRY